MPATACSAGRHLPATMHRDGSEGAQRMEALPVDDGALGGVLAHYSMIHTLPGELPALLAE